jgi:hypothetical protein
MLVFVLVVVLVVAWGLRHLWLNREATGQVKVQSPYGDYVDSKRSQALAVDMAIRAAVEVFSTRLGWA